MLPMLRKKSDLSSFMDDFFGRNTITNFFGDEDKYSIPAVNVKETNEAFEIEVAAPGLNKKDFKINIDNNMLIISSEKQEEKEEKNKKIMRKEFHYYGFKRSFYLPETVNMDKIKAKHNNGILYIEIPKREEAKAKPARLIEIL